MKVLCRYNLGKDLRDYEREPLLKEAFGRFGASEFTEYEELEIGKEYLVMGIIIFETYQAFLIDNNSSTFVCPCQLFKISDHNIPTNWNFRLIDKSENIYPYVQSIISYPEFCFNKNAYESLIIEKDKEAERIYFKQKMSSFSN